MPRFHRKPFPSSLEELEKAPNFVENTTEARVYTHADFEDVDDFYAPNRARDEHVVDNTPKASFIHGTLPEELGGREGSTFGMPKFAIQREFEGEEENVEQTPKQVMKTKREKKHERYLEKLAEKDRDGSREALLDIWRHIRPLHRMTRDEIVQFLSHRVLYEDENMLAINKPYGLACQSGTGVTLHLAQLLQPLQQLHCPTAETLKYCNRLDQNAVGVLLLAKSAQSWKHIKQQYVERKITKMYNCITTRVPDVPEGTVRIPLGFERSGGRFKMQPMTGQLPTDDTVAVTQYRVNQVGAGYTAHVECLAQTGARHQIRAHLGVGLQCPILGDHKYSHYDTFKPQRLNTDTCRALGVRPERCRDLPMFLHASDVIIPRSSKGGNIHVQSQTPRFFHNMLRKLQLIAR